MIIQISKDVSVIQHSDGAGVIVTRLNVFGCSTTCVIDSPYDAIEIGKWLNVRTHSPASALLIHDAFPQMTKEDREFLLTGLAPDVWAAMFPASEDHDD